MDQISIEDLRQQPYKATVTYTKSYYTQLDHVLRGRDKFSAHVQFIVMDKVPHNLVPVNPLGLTITYLREDQAFTDSPNQKVSPMLDQSSPTPSVPGGQPGYPSQPAYLPPSYGQQSYPAPTAPVRNAPASLNLVTSLRSFAPRVSKGCPLPSALRLCRRVIPLPLPLLPPPLVAAAGVHGDAPLFLPV